MHNVPDSDPSSSSTGSDAPPIDQEAAAAANALRSDYLLLALEKGSIAQRYLLSLPPEYRTSWKHAMSCLQRRFASQQRMDMVRLSIAVTARAERLACTDTLSARRHGKLLETPSRAEASGTTSTEARASSSSWMISKSCRRGRD